MEDLNNRLVRREKDFTKEKNEAIDERIHVIERDFEVKALEFAKARSELSAEIENDKKALDRQRAKFTQETRKLEINAKVKVRGLS